MGTLGWSYFCRLVLSRTLYPVQIKQPEGGQHNPRSQCDVIMVLSEITSAAALWSIISSALERPGAGLFHWNVSVLFIVFFSAFLVNMSPLSQSVQFDVRPGVCMSGASPESLSRLLAELSQYGTHYLRLSHFSLQSTDKKGLVFQVCAAIIAITAAQAPHRTPSLVFFFHQLNLA